MNQKEGIKKHKKIFDAWRKDKTDYVLDIANGGYPAEIKSLAKNKEIGN